MERERRSHEVYIKPGWIIVICDDKGKDWLELRPVYETTLGPCLDLYRVNGTEGAYLVRLPANPVRELVKFIPTALNAARRLRGRSAV